MSRVTMSVVVALGLSALVQGPAWGDERPPAPAKVESEGVRAGRLEAEKDAAAKDVAAKDAAAKDAAAKDAAAKDVAAKDVAAKDGAAKDGATAKDAPPIAGVPAQLPKTEDGLDASMKGFAEELRKQMTDLGDRMAKDIKTQLTPEVMRRISDAMGTLKKETDQAAKSGALEPAKKVEPPTPPKSSESPEKDKPASALP